MNSEIGISDDGLNWIVWTFTPGITFAAGYSRSKFSRASAIAIAEIAAASELAIMDGKTNSEIGSN